MVPDMTNTPVPVAPLIKPLRILIGVSGSSLVMFGVFVYFILPNGDYPPIWVAWALGGLALTSHLLCQTVGFNLKPVPAGTLPAEAMAMAGAAFQASSVLRFALSESVAIVALVLSFAVLPASWMTYPIGGVLALILLAVNVWPGTAVISKAQQRLDQDGGQSFLLDALLGLAPGTTASGTIRS
jgi:hypothetical protein